MKNISKLLVANRGEIAIRVFRAASELGIPTVALYTYEDRFSLHRYKADESYLIGKTDDPLKPYLDVETVINAAKKCGADAIHPGYGFLSENVQLARSCREEGIIFIGPEPEAMEQLGDKIKAKILARKAQVPLIEDNEQPITDYKIAHYEAMRIGFPIMVKAAAGGGGRGMRVVWNESDLEKAYNEARSEAAKAFGDDTIFLEKFIDRPKHIEVQIMADNFGNMVHLFERDCSVQRRFQKVVEVAPAPSLAQETKAKLYEYALRIARAVNYNNVGTVEFLVDPEGNVYFIEVNPRIQVEHTITEEITRVDIVRSQILIAKGHKLADPEIFITKQEDVTIRGFAIQCRITTEDPENNFKPDFGTILTYRNAAGFGIRLDEGSSYTGMRISPFFDSLLVKVSASGRTLKGTSMRLHRALTEFRIRGVKTNIGFLENVISHPVFLSGQATVNFIAVNQELLKFQKPKNRANKLLNYLGKVSVNGHPEVLHPDKSKLFRPPFIPDYPTTLPPKGTKQKLTELGPEGFSNWLKAEKCIHYTDTTLRDAHQSLLATRMRTLDMLAITRSFAHHHPQTFSLECWGGATFDVALRFLHECPWGRLKQLREAAPNILLQMLIRGSNAVGYKSYPDNLVEKFIEKAGETGVDIFRIFDSLNLISEMTVSINAVRNYTGGIAEAAICYTGEMLDPNQKKYNLQYYLDMARRLEDAGAHILAIKDMAGLLKPFTAELLISSLKEAVSLPIHLHTHDTASIQSATYLKAIEAGVDVVDVAIASLSGVTAQPNFNSIVAMMAGHSRELPYDMDSLNQFSNYWEDVRELYYPFESDLKTGTAQVYQHEIPGGQYSNLRPQARSLGLEDQFEQIKRNYAIANRMFGDIIKVTPSSKIVGDFALFLTSNNLSEEDIFEKGHLLSFPDSVISFFKGEIGIPFGGFPKRLQEIILKGEKPNTGRSNEGLEPVNFDAEYPEFQKKYGENVDFLDYLSWKMYPKVFDEFYAHNLECGVVEKLPTKAFFYGLEIGEEIDVEISPGKILIIRLEEIGHRLDEKGNRNVIFELNGQMRQVLVKDHKFKSTKQPNAKAQGERQIGSPLQGKIGSMMVKEGDSVDERTPLFVIEAMKMETVVTANQKGIVTKIQLPSGSMVAQDDLVLELG